ncbi:Subtilisin-like serine proteases [Marinactinospora thermotolerans DSM 45154]|uniref:Subtilisin-like serine proteases n=1 Tax=Marinactinospora thermotolerans DSM 45154 TaxID=1122192 RepID=A0A1T4JZY0_9ACTN|nr:S8 family serine peptidase [Marinactinospora thermotolerans]SJZ35713.1 Subtilisin-like serine proteases [Marinactinospora thermotolerans DSM 45154]
MVTCRFGGTDGFRLELLDHDDLVVVRTRRRGTRHETAPLGRRSREAGGRLSALFGLPDVGVDVYAAPTGAARELADIIHTDPEVRFAGRGLRDPSGAPVVYTENVFVKFADDASADHCERVLAGAGLTVKRTLGYARGAYFVAAPEGTGPAVFDLAEELLDRDDVDLCHPELIREPSHRAAFPHQWHLGPVTVDGRSVDAHANVVAAWQTTRGEGTTICVIDDGFDIDHREFSSDGKIVAPRSASPPRSGDPRPGHGNHHGTACAGVACADGVGEASGVAPAARLMPIRLVSGLGSQDEADAFVWAADHGADIISCSWGPRDGRWWDPSDPLHDQVVPLPDSTRLAIDHAVRNGRGGRGCVVVWAAGNGAESVDNDGYASNEQVIAVAACNDRGEQSAYSDHGEAIWCCFPSSDGHESLTPGIWTTDRRGRDGYNPGDSSLGDERGDYTNSFGGTSSACPGAAGVAALILATAPELTWSEVKDVIRVSARRIDDTPGEYDERGHSKRYGYGRVDAKAAVAEAASRAAAGRTRSDDPEAGEPEPPLVPA